METSTEIKMGQLTKQWNPDAKSITFCVTEDCNLMCKYCYMTGKNTKNKMSFETAKKAVDYILSDRTFNQDAVIWEFIGGEPFIEIELIDKVSDYIKQQMFLLQHPWFNKYRFNFSTNGLLYGTPQVQEYIKKNKGHISIGISVDGNKVKHDLQRVKKDGSGSYDDIVKIVPLWIEQFPGASTKATFSHDDLPYLKDSIISLWEIGIKMVSANVIFEDVWQEGDDILFENQLKELADYIIENKLYYDYSVRFFDPLIGGPIAAQTLEENFCGAGKMMAIDCHGSFFPCCRFYDISLNNRKGLKIGDINNGVDHDRERAFLSLTLKNQSTEECINCEVGNGCAWCKGHDYDIAETGTIYHRSTYICKMHKANVRANEYFWNKFSEVTGLPSEMEKKKTAQEATNQTDSKHMFFITEDKITPHCMYKSNKNGSSVMDATTFERGLEFCKNNSFAPVILGDKSKYGEYKFINFVNSNTKQLKENSILLFDNVLGEAPENVENCTLLVTAENIRMISEFVEKYLTDGVRINLVLKDIENWNNENINEYEKQLDSIVEILYKLYNDEKNAEVNVITDLWYVDKMCNCDAGKNTLALAPNGRIYLCPAFYFDDPDNYVGSLDDGINVKYPRLFDLENSRICSHCDVYSCKRCAFLNMKMTNEVHVPPKIQCLVSHLERNKSMQLQKLLMEKNLIDPLNIIKGIDYMDPLDDILRKLNRKKGL